MLSSGVARDLYGRESEAKLAMVVVDSSVELSRVAGERVPLRLPTAEADEFVCVVPRDLVVHESTAVDAGAGDAARVIGELRQLLLPMHEACIYKPAGWWTVELCSARHTVRQFHAQDNGVVRNGDQHFLGTRRDDAATILTADYLSETLLDGSVCDVTGLPRQTEVRYACDRTRDSTWMANIHEPQSCHYLLFVHTPLLCPHPHFAGQARRSLNELRCQFAGDDEQRAARIDRVVRELRRAAVSASARPDLSVHQDGVFGAPLVEVVEALKKAEPPQPLNAGPVDFDAVTRVAENAALRAFAQELRSVPDLRLFTHVQLDNIAALIHESYRAPASDALDFTQKQTAAQNELVNRLTKSLAASVEQRDALRRQIVRILDARQRHLGPAAADDSAAKDAAAAAAAALQQQAARAAIE